jgi:hypothetical protein
MQNPIQDSREKLARELAELIKQQRDALEAASLFRVTAEEASAYDERHERIAKLTQVLDMLKIAA